jgi:hypothetical protein
MLIVDVGSRARIQITYVAVCTRKLHVHTAACTYLQWTLKRFYI